MLPPVVEFTSCHTSVFPSCWHSRRTDCSLYWAVSMLYGANIRMNQRALLPLSHATKGIVVVGVYVCLCVCPSVCLSVRRNCRHVTVHRRCPPSCECRCIAHCAATAGVLARRISLRGGGHALYPVLSSFWAVMIVWKITWKIIGTVLCCFVHHNCARS